MIYILIYDIYNRNGEFLDMWGKYFLIFATLLFASLSLSAAQKIKAIVFDFGGVIGKTDRQEIISFVAKSLSVSNEEAIKILENLKASSLKDNIENDYWLNEDFWVNYSRAKNIQLPPHWIEKLNDERLKAVRVIPGMISLVKNLKTQGYRVALLSNERKSQAQIKRKLGLYYLFDPTILSYEIRLRKPDLNAYYLMLNRLNLPAQNVLFIDDKPENVAAAKAIGIDAILFKDLSQLISALKERGIQSN